MPVSVAVLRGINKIPNLPGISMAAGRQRGSSLLCSGGLRRRALHKNSSPQSVAQYNSIGSTYTCECGTFVCTTQRYYSGQKLLQACRQAKKPLVKGSSGAPKEDDTPVCCRDLSQCSHRPGVGKGVAKSAQPRKPPDTYKQTIYSTSFTTPNIQYTCSTAILCTRILWVLSIPEAPPRISYSLSAIPLRPPRLAPIHRLAG